MRLPHVADYKIFIGESRDSFLKTGKVGETQMKNKLLKRGIEPIIAVVILVAITLVIAIGVIGWIMGWWGTFGATESLQFYPDSYIDTSGKLYLHIKNAGSASAVIYKVEVSGIGTATQASVVAAQGSINTGANAEVTVAPGAEGTVEFDIKLSGSPVAGANYLVKIYTRAGNVYSVTVQAK
jgi:flagellin-like protein